MSSREGHKKITTNTEKNFSKKFKKTLDKWLEM